MLVTFDDVNARLDTPLDDSAQSRVEVLIEDAVAIVRTAFLKCGRDFDAELERVAWLADEAARVVREMVSAAIAIGPNAGVRSVSSATGQESDSITYANGIDFVSFGGVKLTPDQRAALGLCMPGGARGNFPGPVEWPEVRHRGARNRARGW